MSDSDAVALADRVGRGHLVTASGNRVESTLIPFVIGSRSSGPVVRSHLARANPHHRLLGDGADAMVIVTGPDAYVSPSWYRSQQDHGRVVPTWNYSLVHLRGRIRLIRDRDELLELVTTLTNRHEETRETPWAVSDAPEEFIDAQLRAIVGVELDITEIEGQAKLSQNRTDADRDGVRRALAQGDEMQRAVGSAMT